MTGRTTDHKRSLLVSCSVSVVVTQSSTPCQQTFPCCTVCLVWLALGARKIPYATDPHTLIRPGNAKYCIALQLGFERDEGKVSINRGIEGQGINRELKQHITSLTITAPSLPRHFTITFLFCLFVSDFWPGLSFYPLNSPNLP